MKQLPGVCLSLSGSVRFPKSAQFTSELIRDQRVNSFALMSKGKLENNVRC